MNHLNSYLVLAGAALMAAPAFAQDVLIDFGTDNGADGFNAFNNPNTGSLVASDLLDTFGASSGIDLTVALDPGDSGFIVDTTTSITDSSGTFGDMSANDGFRINGSDFGALNLTFSDLDDSEVYTFTLFVGSGLFFTANVDYTIGGTTELGIDATVENLLIFDNVTSTGGIIELEIQANGSGNAFSRGAAINAVLISSEVPEPATYAAIFGGLALSLALMRRRLRK